MNVAKFLRTPILKNICEWLLLKISTLVTNFTEGRLIPEFDFPFKPFSILNFAMTEWFCYVTCFAKTFLAYQKTGSGPSGTIAGTYKNRKIGTRDHSGTLEKTDNRDPRL